MSEVKVDYDPFAEEGKLKSSSEEPLAGSPPAVPAQPREGEEKVDYDPFAIKEDFKLPDEVVQLADEAVQLGAGFNKFLTQLGAPVDAVNWMLNTLGVTDVEDAFLGSKNIENMLKSMGAKTTPDEGSVTGRVGQELGAATVPFGIFAKVARTGKQLTGAISKYFNPIVSYVAQNPVIAALGDLGFSTVSGASAWAGAEIAEAVTGDKQYREVGDITGSIVGPVSVAGAIGATKKVGSAVRTILAPTKEQITKSAGEVLESHMSPQTVGKLVTDDPSLVAKRGVASTGQLAEDPQLISLQRAVEKSQLPSAQVRGQEFKAEQKKSLEKSLGVFGAKVADAVKDEGRDFFERRIQTAVDNIEDIVTKSLKKADNALRATATDANVEDVSVVVKNKLDDAYKAAREEENKLWKATGSAAFDVTPIKDAARNVLDELQKTTDLKDIPPVLFEIVDFDKQLYKRLPKTIRGGDTAKGAKVKKLLKTRLLNDEEPIEVINELRSTLGEAISIAKSQGEANKARRLTKVFKATVDDIVPTGIDAEDVLEKTNAARKFSENLHDVFTSGPIGTVRRVSRQGDLVVPPEETLAKVLGKGEKGYDALVKTVEKVPQNVEIINKNVVDYLTASFANDTTDWSGNFVPSAAKRFISKNEGLLNRFPQLKDKLTNAVVAKEMSENISKSAKNKIDRIKTRSVAAKYISGDLGARMDSVLSSKTPEKNLNMLLAAASKDKTEATKKALKGAFFDSMNKRVAPNDAIQHAKLNKFIKDYSPLIKKLYKERGLNLLKEISIGAKRGELAANLPNRGVYDNGKAKVQAVRDVTGSLGVIIGAKLGRMLGTNELLVASKTRTIIENKVANALMKGEVNDVLTLVEDALYDPQLAGYLLRQSKLLSKNDILSLNKYAAIRSLMSPSKVVGNQETNE